MQNKVVNFVNQVFFILASGNLLVNKTDLQALNHTIVTYCHRTGTILPSCVKPRQPTIYLLSKCFRLYPRVQSRGACLVWCKLSKIYNFFTRQQIYQGFCFPFISLHVFHFFSYSFLHAHTHTVVSTNLIQ